MTAPLTATVLVGTPVCPTVSLFTVFSSSTLAEGEQYPPAPSPYSSYLSTQDRTDQSTPLPASDTHRYQSTLGDMLWLQRLSKPEATFAHQHLSRTSHPTLCDYHLGVRVLQYCTGTAGDTRWTGGPHGPTATATADSSLAFHSDLKSQSAWTTHTGGGGATSGDSKKQSTTADSSTTSEAAGSALLCPDCKYAASTLEELEYLQPSATCTSSDTTSTTSGRPYHMYFNTDLTTLW